MLTLTLFFFAATLFQLYELNLKIQDAPELENTELLQQTESNATLMETQWRTLVVLESHVLQQRYHQANVLLMARIWIRYLGFVTGMMLALIGAVFILGKLREPTTTLTLSGVSPDPNLPGNFKAQLLTQSPGIVLVTLGTVLMLLTILVHHPIQVNDAPVYTSVTTTVNNPVAPPIPANLDLGFGLDSGSGSGSGSGSAELDSSAGPLSEYSEKAAVDQTALLLEQARQRHLQENSEASQ